MKIIIQDIIYNVSVYTDLYDREITFSNSKRTHKVKVIQSCDFKFSAEDLIEVIEFIQLNGFVEEYEL